MTKRTATVLACLTLLPAAMPQTMKAPDITRQPTLYVVPYAHLDTQWRWEFPQVISEYLLKTMRVNFDYIDKYPHYVFNWTGANRYRLMKEYFPNDFARMKKYVDAGRWFPAGSSMEEGDVNLPSAEGIFRQVLYGNTWFRNEFGKASEEYMLPDCFGFPASLPTILAHAGVKGFSTQKLSAAWQPAPKVGGPNSPEHTPEGIPFNVGVWTGTDGEQVIAALNPGDYGSNVFTDLTKSTVEAPLTPEQAAKLTPQHQRMWQRMIRTQQDWPARIDVDGKLTGVFADYHYVGTGDIGGATREFSAKLLEAIVSKSKTVLPVPTDAEFAEEEPNREPEFSGPEVQVGEGPVHVIVASADQMFKDIDGNTTRMPRYKGDLELINHSAGSLTSQAYHKRWVVKSELLAGAAEQASVAAAWMGGRTYPQERLNNAWTLVMGGHFHDTAAGTATPKAYEFAWNDDLIALNQFAGVLTDASGAVASGMNTQGEGVPIVVCNPLNIARRDIVQAKLNFPSGTPSAVRVVGPDGKDIPAQVEGDTVLFLADVPSLGYAVYDVRPTDSATAKSGLHVDESSLENARYRVKLDQNGDVASVFDKNLNKELLSSPIRLAISTDRPSFWPAWNMDFSDEQAAPRAWVSGPAQIRIKENGPVRVSLEITREAENSKFVQTISLSAGEAGNRVQFDNAVDWRALAANLKAVFPLSASNENATYNWEVGTVQRPTENERQFEVASHRWIDLTDSSGTYGAAILTDCKNGSDKRSANTIRLTLLRSPGLQPGRNGRPASFTDQANQDWGHHEFVFGVVGHAGDWRQAQTDWQGYGLAEPLVAFESPLHTGTLGKSFSLLRVSDPRIRVLALKKAESSDEVVLRMVELDGKPANNVKVSFAGPLTAAREINAQEQPVGPAKLSRGTLVTSFGPYQPRTFALKLGAPPAKLRHLESRPVTLNYDLAAASNDDTRTEGGGFDGKGNALPAEMLPSELSYHDVEFKLAPAKTGTPDAIVAKGQTVNLPSGDYNRVYILAAADGDQNATFKIGDKPVDLSIAKWGGFIGQWDTRIWKNEPARDWAISANHAPWPPPANWPKRWEPLYPGDYVGLRAGYVKPVDVAWYASHHHTAEGLNEPYQYSYLFVYPVEVPRGARMLTLPDNDKIRIFAISVASGDVPVTPVQPLYDHLGRTEPGTLETAQDARQ
jgi:alpha-mannosidase